MVYRIRVSAISWFVMADLANGMDALCNVCCKFYDEYEAVSVIGTVLLIKNTVSLCLIDAITRI